MMMMMSMRRKNMSSRSEGWGRLGRSCHRNGDARKIAADRLRKRWGSCAPSTAPLYLLWHPLPPLDRRKAPLSHQGPHDRHSCPVGRAGWPVTNHPFTSTLSGRRRFQSNTRPPPLQEESGGGMARAGASPLEDLLGSSSSSFWEAEYERLEQASRQLLGSSSSLGGQPQHHHEDILEQWLYWLSFPPQQPETSSTMSTTTTPSSSSSSPLSNGDEDSLEAAGAWQSEEDRFTMAVERMQDLYRAWQLPRREAATTSSSPRPYAVMLQVYRRHCPDGRAALQVLQDWNQQHTGDLAREPRLEHYEAVLEAYGRESRVRDDPTRPKEAASVALEVLQALEVWGYAMKPTLSTYRWGVACITRVLHIKDSDASPSNPDLELNGSRHYQTRNDGDSQQERKLVYMQALEEIISKLLQPWVQATSSPAAAVIDPQPPLIVQKMSESDQINTIMALSDAILASWNWYEQGYGRITDRIDQQSEPSWMTWIRIWNLLIRWPTTPSRLRSEISSSSDASAFLEGFLHPTVNAVSKLCYWEGPSLEETAPLMEATVDTIQTLYCPSPQDPLPTGMHYYFVIRALSDVWRAREARHHPQRKRAVRRENGKVPENILKWLSRMRERHQARFDAKVWPEHEPVTQSFNRLMMAYMEAGQIADVMDVWREMNRNPQIRRDGYSYTIVLKTLAMAGEGEHAHAIWRNLVFNDGQHVVLTAQHFSWVMLAWSRSRVAGAMAAEKCREVFDRLLLEAQTNPDVKPTTVHYSALLVTLGKSQQQQSLENVLALWEKLKRSEGELMVADYMAVLIAFGQTRCQSGAEAAEEILREIEARRSSEKNANCVADAECFNNVMKAWVQSGSPHSPARCEALLHRLEKAFLKSGYDSSLRPDAWTYTMLIQAHVEHAKPDQKGKVALYWLQRMRQQSLQRLSDPPDMHVYAHVMTAVAKCSSATDIQRLEALRQEMQADYERGNLSVKPNARIMNLLLTGWGNCDSPNKAQEAWKVLQEMCAAYQQGDVDMRPSPMSFATVLKACAFTRTRDKAAKAELVKIALTVHAELEKGEYGGPNEITYRNLFKVLCRHLDDMNERTHVSKLVFQRCCQEGMLNKDILEDISRFIPPLYKQLPGWDQVPANWTRCAGR